MKGDDIQALTIAGASAHNLGKNSEAVIYFEKILEIDSHNISAHTNLIPCYQELKMQDECLNHIWRILQIDCFHIDAMNNIGRFLLEQYDLDGSLYFFDQLVRIEEKEPIFWTNKGMVFNDLKKFEEAIICFDHALLLDPTYKFAVAHKSVSLVGLDRLDDMSSLIELYFKLDSSTDQTPQDHTQKMILLQHAAVAAAKKGKLDEALEFYNQYLSITNDKNSLRSKADTLTSLNRFEEALHTYEKYLKIEPFDFEALVNKITCLLKTGYYVRAVTCASFVFRFFSKSNLSYNLGMFFEENGQSDEAEFFFEMSLDENATDYTSLRYNAITYTHLKRYTNAIDTYEQMLKINPKDIFVLQDMATILEESLEKFDHAIKIYDRILQLEPKHHFSWAHKGACLARINKNDEAIALYNEFLKDDPDDPTILTNKGVALSATGKSERSLKYFNRALEIKPIDAITLYGKGQALNRLKRFSEALEALDEAVEIDPNFYGTYLEMGNSYLELGKIETAIENFIKSLNLQPKAPSVLFNLSQAYRLQGDVLNSIRYYNEFLGTGARYVNF